MKKYLLLLLVFGVIFLWLGNSQASAICSTTRADHSSDERGNGSHKFTCEYNAATNSACTDNVGKAQTCYPAVTWDGCSLYCCVCTNNNPTTPTAVPCEWGDGSSWICVCPTGMVESPAGTCIWSTTPSTLDCKPTDFEKANVTDTDCVCIDWYKRLDTDKKCHPCSEKWVCCGIELNTNVPFIGNCIEDESSNDPTAIKTDEAFPVLMSSLTKILVTVILIVSFILIIVWGIMIASGNPSWGKKMIIKVVVGIALLGASGVILRLINPNFFG